MTWREAQALIVSAGFTPVMVRDGVAKYDLGDETFAFIDQREKELDVEVDEGSMAAIHARVQERLR